MELERDRESPDHMGGSTISIRHDQLSGWFATNKLARIKCHVICSTRVNNPCGLWRGRVKAKPLMVVIEARTRVIG